MVCSAAGRRETSVARSASRPAATTASGSSSPTLSWRKKESASGSRTSPEALPDLPVQGQQQVGDLAVRGVGGLGVGGAPAAQRLQLGP